MISCTEFIPLYSEFFKYCEAKGGHDAVMEYWIHISDTSIGDKTNPNSLAYKCEKYGGFMGAMAYWGHTLTEEACDLMQISNNDKKIKYSHMRHCPSRGMLNSLKHVEPYWDYCSHCNVIYERVLKNYGIEFIRDNSDIENASCKSLLFEKGSNPGFDFKTASYQEIIDKLSGDSLQVIDMKTEDNKYLHRDFHLLGDNALKYCGDKYGKDAVIEFLQTYVKNYYSPIIDKIKVEGLPAIKSWIEKVYEIEESSELLHTELSENKLTVSIDKSPVIEYMKSLNQKPSEYYIEQTRTLYKTVAELTGFKFDLEYYEEDGKTRFSFYK